MAKGIRARVENSFKDSDSENIVKYLDWLRPAISDQTQEVRRSITIAILLMAAFLVIVQSHNSTVNLGPFRISNGSVVTEFIPPLVAYLIYQSWISSVRLRLMHRMFTAVFRKWSADAEANDLDLFVKSSSPVYWSVDEIGNESFGLADRLQDWVSSYIVMAIFFGVLIFEWQAYQMLARMGFTNHTEWLISVGATIIFCSLTLGHFLLYMNSKWTR